MKYFWIRQGHNVIMGAFILGIVTLLVFLFLGFSEQRDAFMKECLADGRKNYECESKFHPGRR